MLPEVQQAYVWYAEASLTCRKERVSMGSSAYCMAIGVVIDR